jgi:hypothetical protein
MPILNINGQQEEYGVGLRDIHICGKKQNIKSV